MRHSPSDIIDQIKQFTDEQIREQKRQKQDKLIKAEEVYQYAAKAVQVLSLLERGEKINPSIVYVFPVPCYLKLRAMAKRRGLTYHLEKAVQEASIAPSSDPSRAIPNAEEEKIYALLMDIEYAISMFDATTQKKNDIIHLMSLLPDEYRHVYSRQFSWVKSPYEAFQRDIVIEDPLNNTPEKGILMTNFYPEVEASTRKVPVQGVVRCVFAINSNDMYSFLCDIPVAEKDIVVVDTQKGPKTAYVVEVAGIRKPLRDLATKDVICIVDVTKFKEEQAKRKEIAEIRATLTETKKEFEEMEFFKMMAATNPKAHKLLTRLGDLEGVQHVQALPAADEGRTPAPAVDNDVAEETNESRSRNRNRDTEEEGK